MTDVSFRRYGRVRVAELKTGDQTEAIWVGPQLTISAHPENSGKALYEYTTSPIDSVTEETARWIPWVYGEVTVPTSTMTQGRITAIRGRCTAGTAVFEVVG